MSSSTRMAHSHLRHDILDLRASRHSQIEGIWTPWREKAKNEAKEREGGGGGGLVSRAVLTPPSNQHKQMVNASLFVSFLVCKGWICWWEEFAYD